MSVDELKLLVRDVVLVKGRVELTFYLGAGTLGVSKEPNKFCVTSSVKSFCNVVWQRGQEPIAKWPEGCCALLVPDPFSKLGAYFVPLGDSDDGCRLTTL